MTRWWKARIGSSRTAGGSPGRRNAPCRTLALCYGAALAAAGGCVSDRPDSSGPVDTSGEPVAIESFAYGPPELTVTVGAAVVWTNRDPVVHTVTADDGSFDSSVLSQGEVFRLVPDHAGTFPYFCSVHPFMRGTLNVAP
jgi:plastocyanin